ncbi:glycoside hydrolase family 43 protein [Diaminobutyricibacter sp. McL0608]|uniref:glycoside hydrolase family 43 protein n=1 Tax=Leifsonia sp. McL0608 TaxID=3143537 RepID=UPI0031F305BC
MNPMSAPEYRIAPEEANVPWTLDPSTDRFEFERSADQSALERVGRESALYVSRAAAADSRVTTRIIEQSALHESGIFLRNDYTAGDRAGCVTLGVTAANRLVMTWDPAGAETYAVSSAEPISVPLSLRLTRNGIAVTSSFSVDGMTWTKLHTALVPGSAERQDAGFFAATTEAAKVERVSFESFTVDATETDRHSSPYLAIGMDFPDPAVIEADGTFYAYSTNLVPAWMTDSSSWDSDNSDRILANVGLATADDPYGTWTYQGDALPVLPPWTEKGRVWAPDVDRLDDGSYIMYYTTLNAAALAATQEYHECIGAATASSPRGPFVPVGEWPLIARSDSWALDPSAFVDTDGTRYLLYTQRIGDDITQRLQKVAADGITFLGESTPLLHQSWTDGSFEAPHITKHADKYYLFYSTGDFSTYATRYAVADAVAGPYTRVETPLLAPSPGLLGPGAMVTLRPPAASDTDAQTIAFHIRLMAPTVQRGMAIAEMVWDDGTPRVDLSRPLSTMAATTKEP